MDIYSEDEVSADDLLEGVDVDAMNSEIVQQSIDSGFAEEAARIAHIRIAYSSNSVCVKLNASHQFHTFRNCRVHYFRRIPCHWNSPFQSRRRSRDDSHG